jgi:hypothetical protein
MRNSIKLKVGGVGTTFALAGALATARGTTGAYFRQNQGRQRQGALRCGIPDKVKADDSIVTPGDDNTTADPWVVQRRDIIGGVVASAPQLGYWLVYLKSLTGLASIVCAVVGTGFLWSIARDLDDKPDSDGADNGCGNPDHQRAIELANPAQPSLV